MKNSKITRIVNKYKKEKKYDLVELKNLNTAINTFAKYVRDNYKDLSDDEIRNELLNEICQINLEYTSLANPKGLYYQLIASRQVKKDKKFIQNAYEEIKDEPIEGEIRYGWDLEDNKKKIVKEYYGAIKKTMEDNKKEMEKIAKAKDNPSYRKQYLKQNSHITPEILKEIIEGYTGSYPDMIYNNINKITPTLERELKEHYIKNLEYLGKFFNKFGLLERYNKRHSQKMFEMGCKDLNFEDSTGKYDIDNIGVQELFKRETLEKIDVDSLMILNLFYQNRFAKEISTLGEAFFTIDTMNLWDKVKSGERIELNQKNLNSMKNKANCIDTILLEIFEMLEGRIKEFSDEEMQEGYKQIDIQDDVAKVSKQEKENYYKIFEPRLEESDNDLEYDLNLYKTIINVRENIYTLREMSFSSLIYFLSQEKTSKNFGIIKEEYIDGKYKDTTKDFYVLVSIDYEGLNMPLRLHINRNNLIDALKLHQKNSLIQVYEGAEDFVKNRDMITTNILMPIPKRHKKTINELYQKTEGKDKFISHLRFLKDKGTDKFPKHLMKKVKKGKEEKYIRKPKHYLNLETGEEFYMEDSKLLPVGEEIEL